MKSQDEVKPGSPKEDEDQGEEGRRGEERAVGSEGSGLHQGPRPGATGRDEDGKDEVKDREGKTSDDETKEVRKPKVGRIPEAPTKRELEEHLPLHMPYKAWCPVCVAGEGIHNQSRRTKEDEKERIGVTISMDYCFLTTDGEAETDPKVLILHDDRLETLWALGVKTKGVTPEVVTWIMNKLEEAGYKGTEITMNTDQEESIMALKRAVAARRETRTSLIESKVRVSVSNSRVERAVRKWRGQFRKTKLHLESKIGRHIPPDHPMIPWMISWSGDAIMKYHVQDNGRTAYETMTGHRVKHVVAGFGEHIHFKVAKDTVQNKFDGEWAEWVLRWSYNAKLRIPRDPGSAHLQVPHYSEESGGRRV